MAESKSKHHHLGQGGRGMQCRVLLLDLSAARFLVLGPASLRLCVSACMRVCLFPLVSVQSTPILLQSRCQLRQAWPGYAGCTQTAGPEGRRKW